MVATAGKDAGSSITCTWEVTFQWRQIQDVTARGEAAFSWLCIFYARRRIEPCYPNFNLSSYSVLRWSQSGPGQAC